MDQLFSSLRDKGPSEPLSSSDLALDSDSHLAAVLAAESTQQYPISASSSPTKDSGWAMVLRKKKNSRKRSTSLSGSIALADESEAQSHQPVDLGAEEFHHASETQDQNYAYSKSSPSYPIPSLPCKFFLSGACVAGKSCRFLHAKSGSHHTSHSAAPHSNGKPKSLCSYYLKGNCKYGDRCALEHCRPQTGTSAKHPSLLQNETPGHYPHPHPHQTQTQHQHYHQRRSSVTLLHAAQNWPTTSTRVTAGLPLSSSVAPAASLVASASALVNPLPQLGSFEQSTPSYDRSLFDDHDSDQDILQLAGSEWMKEFESVSENTILTSSFQFQTSTSQLGQEEKEALTLAPQSSLALTLDRPHSAGSQPLRRHISRFGFTGNENAGFPFSSNQASGMPIDYYDEEGNEHLAAHGADDYFYHDYQESELAYDAYYLGSGGPSTVEESMTVGSTTVMASAAKNNPIMYHAAAATMQNTSTLMPILPLSYSSIIKNHNVGLNPIPAGVLSLPMDNTADATDFSELCAFAKMGSCRYGVKCRYVHGEMCPYCQLFVLHPSNHELRNAHLLKCGSQIDDPNMIDDAEMEELPLTEHDLIECCICYDRISTKPDSRFGLLNCDHAFCLECIRSWRSSQNLDPSVVRSCPICRTVTHFITPSSIWTRDPGLKASIIEEYKGKLRSIPCKYFRYGEAHCPFGTSCFYAHIGRDGRPIDASHGPKLRTCLNDDEQVKVLSEIRLSDFINISSAII